MVLLLPNGFGTVADFREEVVFCDEVAGAGVEGAGEKGAEKQVENGLEGAATEFGQSVIKRELEDEVQKMDVSEGRAVDEHGADGVEEDLEGAEESLAKERIKEEGFNGGGKISIQACHAQRFVVGEVVGLWNISSQSILFLVWDTRSLI